jgi:hypothetical protein
MNMQSFAMAAGMLFLAQQIGAAELSVVRQKPVIPIDRHELRLRAVREKYNGPMMHEKIAAIRETQKELRKQVQQDVASASISLLGHTLDVRRELNDSLEQAKVTTKEQARKVADEIKNARAAARKGEQ